MVTISVNDGIQEMHWCLWADNPQLMDEYESGYGIQTYRSSLEGETTIVSPPVTQ